MSANPGLLNPAQPTQTQASHMNNLNFPNPTLNNAYNVNFTRKIKDNGATGFIFDIIMLQRFILFYLQMSLLRALADLRDDNQDVRPQCVEYLRRRVHDYCDAVRDLEYMVQFKREKNHGGKEDNLFEMRHTRQLERMIIVNQWPGLKLPGAVDTDDPKLPGLKLSKKRHDTDWPWYFRGLLAVIAVVPLIAPVVAILYIPWYGTTWLAPGFAVVAVAFGAAYWPDLRLRDVFAITAGYASVLVVFVGVNVQPLQSLSQGYNATIH